MADKNVLVAIDLGRSPGRNTLAGIHDFFRSRTSARLQILDGTDKLRRTVPIWTANPPDGIITEYPDDARTLAALARLRRPIVFTSYLTQPTSRGRRMARITLDNAKIGAAARAHFDSLGRFASYVFATDRPDFQWSIDRGNAFFARRADAVRKRIVLKEDISSERENLAFARTLSRLPKPIAVFAACDAPALRLLDICRLAGLAVPEQVAVLGADDDALFADNCRPSLSSIRINHRELGRRAAETLDRLLAGRPAKDLCVADAFLGITARESTRLVPPAKALVERALEHIRRHAREPLKPQDVIRRLGVSRQLVELRFRQFHNASLGKTIAFARIGEIKKLLLQPRRQLADIADACGFADVAALSRYFRRETGETPSAWRGTAANPVRIDHPACEMADSPNIC